MSVSPAKPFPRWARHALREILYVLLLGGPALAFYLVAAPRSNAVRFLRALSAIRVDQPDFAAAQRLAADFPSYGMCVDDACAFQFQNRWLHRLGLAPLTEFSAMIRRAGPGPGGGPGGGMVTAIDLAMLVTRSHLEQAPIASALVFDAPEVREQGPFEATITLGPGGHPDRTVVLLTPGSTPAQRARARGFNLQCLTRLGGCGSSRELLPGIWNGARRLQSARLDRPAATPPR